MSSAIKDLIGIFAISSAVSSHLLSKEHLSVRDPWYGNRFFWAGLFGNLPALVALVGHLILVKKPTT